jgi:hypothetical protein
LRLKLTTFGYHNFTLVRKSKEKEKEKGTRSPRLLRCQPRVNTYSHSNPQMKLYVPSYLLAALLLHSQGQVLAYELRGAGERELSSCRNTNTDWLALPNPDEGCSGATPVCVKGDGSEVTEWNAGDKEVPPLWDPTFATYQLHCSRTNVGDSCVVCVNDKSGN